MTYDDVRWHGGGVPARPADCSAARTQTEPDVSPSPNSSPPFAAAPPRGIAIVVEDDDVLRELVVEVLSAGSWAAHGVADLRSARDSMSELRPDLLELDLHLGEETSGELLAELANESSAPATLLVSASEAARDVAADFGVPLLPKPFDIDELLAKADAVVAHAKRQRG
jgi:DNA-binding response OmpR family regulator